MRRGSVLQLLGLGAVAAAITTAVAVLIPWLPVSASKESTRIHFVYWFTTVIAIVVFAAVVAVLAYSVIHFRARPDDDSDGPPTHGHTTLEIVWTAIPAVLVTAISIVSAVVLAQNGRAGSNPLVVQGDRAAVRVGVHLPERQDLRLPDAAEGPAREARHHGQGRHPLVLGARVLAEAGRRARASTTRS